MESANANLPLVISQFDIHSPNKLKFGGLTLIQFSECSSLVNNKLIASIVFYASYNIELFNKWGEYFLIKVLKLGSVVSTMSRFVGHRGRNSLLS